jgi:hypothetical protein
LLAAEVVAAVPGDGFALQAKHSTISSAAAVAAAAAAAGVATSGLPLRLLLLRISAAAAFIWRCAGLKLM